MSRLIALVATGTSVLVLSTVTTPVTQTSDRPAEVVSAAKKTRTGNWCC